MPPPSRRQKGQTGRVLLRPQRDNHAATVAHFCTAVLNRDGSNIAAGGLRRIAEFYRIEAEIRGSAPNQRLAVRRARTAPLVEAFGLWLKESRGRVSAKSRLGEKLGYIARHWTACGSSSPTAASRSIPTLSRTPSGPWPSIAKMRYLPATTREAGPGVASPR
ncbi:MAG TPA: transposase [Allosphingosinicella sp.]|nr:transposase [Allosphingosinicella sp.]